MLISGILLIDKPAGLTSFGVVRRVRRALKVRKVGHLGTLDPFATGLLPLALGQATRLIPFLAVEPKTYWARLRLGEETDTQDLSGEVVARGERLPQMETVRQVAARFVGEIEQVPPMYSAVHHQGQRLYRLALQGVEVPRPPRRVLVHSLEIEEIALPEVSFRVTCAQGTYIRTLAADMGAVLGCGAHLTALRRLAVGPFQVEEALPLAALEEAGAEAVLARIIPPAACLPGMREVSVGPEEAQALKQGRALPWPENGLAAGGPVKILATGELVAVASIRGEGRQRLLAPVRVFSRLT
jgi:tRNA pseudouridine55 synthase